MLVSEINDANEARMQLDVRDVLCSLSDDASTYSFPSQLLVRLDILFYLLES